MIVELSEVEVEVNEQMNTSTPTNDTVDIGVTTPVVTPITSTASVIVTGNRRVSSDSERDQLENELETLRKKLAHTEKKLLEISPSEKILYENENSV
jgi:AmiR/NasT family two-component response regulator